MLRVETDPNDLSSAVDDCLSVCEIVVGIGVGDFSGDGVEGAVHFLDVWLPRVETESSSLP